jgi:hypothetical protein
MFPPSTVITLRVPLFGGKPIEAERRFVIRDVERATAEFYGRLRTQSPEN